MMFFLLMLVKLASCTTTPKDMTGKMFTFPRATNTAHVKLFTPREDFSAVTVCFRSITDLHRDHVLFSLATPSADNDFLVFRDVGNNEVELVSRNVEAGFTEQDYKLNRWQSVCATWDSASGLGQIWMDGKPSIRKFVSAGSNIHGPPKITLGQEQDSYDGGFDINQSFIGMMSDVHMWDHVLSRCEIQSYTDDYTFSPGNVLNWAALDFSIVDNVQIEDKQTLCQ